MRKKRIDWSTSPFWLKFIDWDTGRLKMAYPYDDIYEAFHFLNENFPHHTHQCWKEIQLFDVKNYNTPVIYRFYPLREEDVYEKEC